MGIDHKNKGYTQMKKAWVLVYVLATVFVHANAQKMILSANIQTQEAAKDLYKVEKFFQENATAKSLQTKYKLNIQMELLGAHVLVTIKPIRDRVVKNKLNYLLKDQFPQRFVVNDTPVMDKLPSTKINKKIEPVQKTTVTMKVTKKQEVTVARKEKEVQTSISDELKLFWNNLDSEWIGLVFLALAGFLLIYRSNRQISKIRALQKEVEVYQSKIENDIAGMGEHR